jgi:glutamine synthetase
MDLKTGWIPGRKPQETQSDNTMPIDWRSAISAAKASQFLKDALGADLHHTFTAIKESEYMRVARTIADVDFQLYLHEV